MKINNIQPVFTQSPIDRMDNKREGIDVIRNQGADSSNHRYLLLSNNRVLLHNGEIPYLFKPEQIPTPIFQSEQWVYLGQIEETEYFAQSVDASSAEAFGTIGLREFVLEGNAPEEILGMFAQANSLLSWHKSHGFCAKCGHKSESAHGGWRRDCPACDAQHFPRTDPVVIMLVTQGDNLLLGRGHNFGEKRFSCLAGFMEPGETIAQAARRELFEEAGIEGGEVTFMFDQPWPFPSNLMLGVHVEALSTEIKIDPNELAEAIWVSKGEVVAALKGSTELRFEIPPKIAIARNLMEAYVWG